MATEFYHPARWYDLSINWSARLARELPRLREVFGPPGEKGLLDAGCGTGRQAAGLAKLGYRVTGLDADAEMLALAAEHARGEGASVRLVRGVYDEIPERAPGPFDGVYCLANSLAAAGSAAGVHSAISNFARALRPGGRLFVQVLNFPPMRAESPCVRGPRVVTHEGIEYVSTRLFRFDEHGVEVTNVTMWREGEWRSHAHSGRLYPVTPDEFDRWSTAAGLHIDERWGGYGREPFDAQASVDYILVATRA